MAKGQIVVDIERCKGCELCRTACTPGVIALADDLNAKGYRPVLLDESTASCTGCGLCAVMCPEACITVYRQVPQRSAMAVAT